MTALIATRELSKRYGAVAALSALSVEIPEGLIGLIGPNGAGKSTLIKVLLGLLNPSGGSASVLGHDIHRDAANVRAVVGYMPEHDCLPLDITATEFVVHMARISGLPATAARERAADTLRHVGLGEERYRHMSGYSTGMKQRVKLAQALVHDPRLVFLDEPTNGLDPEGRDEMLALVARTAREFGIHVMLSTHLLGEVERVCDSLVLIDQGTLVEQGPIADFTAATAVLDLEVEGDPAPLVARLRGAGFEVEQDGSRLEVSADGTAPYDLIRDAAADYDLGLMRMRQRRRSLEALFRGRDAGGGDV